MSITTLHGDCREMLQTLPAGSVQCVVTSPPYYGLRKYSDDPREIGQEATPALYVAALVDVFRQVRRVLRDDGTVWLNLGDSYASAWATSRRSEVGLGSLPDGSRAGGCRPNRLTETLKEKDLMGIPWRVAFALQDDGWYLRSDIIWAKPNCMPESVTDRPTRAHEYVFLLTKQARYFYDAAAIAEQSQSDHNSGNGFKREARVSYQNADGSPRGNDEQWTNVGGTRNKRTVWTIATQPFSGTKTSADYVGRDGKPYKASVDCPIHSHLAKKQNGQTQQHDAQQDPATNRSADTQNDRAPAHLDELNANSRRAISSPAHPSEDESQSYSSQTHTPESNHDRKMSAKHFSEDSAPGQTHDHTMSSYSQHGHPTGETNYSILSSHDSANGHSTESHKTARAPESDSAYIAFAQTADGTQRTPALPATAAPGLRKPSSKTEADSVSDDLFAQMGIDIADSEKLPLLFPEALQRNGFTKHYTCTCEVSQADHYATMPEALIAPCILAGSSARVCEHCGAAWGRVVERESNWQERKAAGGTAGNVGTSDTYQNGVHGAGMSHDLGPKAVRDLGFAPRCRCAANTGAARSVVLDPFAGSGTVGKVALRYQRDAVLIELSQDYIDDHIETRTDGVQVELFV